MGFDTATTLQYSAKLTEDKLRDLMAMPGDEALMAYFKDGGPSKPVGRAFRRYWDSQVFHGGGRDVLTAGGDFAAMQSEVADQLYSTLKAGNMAIGYTEHAFALLSTPGASESVGQKILKAVKDKKHSDYLLALGRGDGFVGRGVTAGSVTTAVFDQPPRCMPGDVISSKADSSGDGRGLGGGAALESQRIDSVDPVGKSISWTTADTVAADDMYYLASAANNASGAGVYPEGLEAMFDSSADNWQWDPTDDSTYDHVDTYLGGGTRGTTVGLNVSEVNFAGNMTIANVGKMMRKCKAVGAKTKDLIIICNELVYQVLCENNVGYVPRTLTLPIMGTNYEVAVMDGFGSTGIKVITSEYMPDNLIVCADTDKMFKLTAPGGWSNRTGSIWNIVAGSTNPHRSQWMAYYITWDQRALVKPFTSCVGYGVTTT